MVRRKLKGRNPNKSPGKDKIHPRELEGTSAKLSIPLTKIYQNSLKSGRLPKQWKEGVIIAIYKKGKRSTPTKQLPPCKPDQCCMQGS